VTSAELTNSDAESRRERILDVVADMLENEGYDAVQLREVARRARTSLATIYKRYGTRDELIVATLERWMNENRFAALAAQTGDADESLYDGLMRLLRTIFEPWEHHPGMLNAYFRARAAPGGQGLIRRGFAASVPAGIEVLANADSGFVRDLSAILSSLAYGLSGRFAAGEIEISEILPTLDRTVFWLTAGYERARPGIPTGDTQQRGGMVTKDHGPSVKNDKQYEGLRKKGMSKSRAAAISNSSGSSSRGGKSSGSSQSSRSSGSGSGGNQSQKKAAGRKGGKKSS